MPGPKLWEAIVLDLEKVSAAELLQDSDVFHVGWNPLLRSWLVRVNAYVWARTVDHETHVLEIRVPLTIFDHLKLWLGRGNVRWRKIRKKVRFTLRATYPGLNLPIPGRGGEAVLKVRKEEIPDEQ